MTVTCSVVGIFDHVFDNVTLGSLGVAYLMNVNYLSHVTLRHKKPGSFPEDQSGKIPVLEFMI